jgi:prephenate dehydratase
VRFLGSHPRADGVAASIAPSADNADFVSAAEWVESIRKGETA